MLVNQFFIDNHFLISSFYQEYLQLCWGLAVDQKIFHQEAKIKNRNTDCQEIFSSCAKQPHRNHVSTCSHQFHCGSVFTSGLYLLDISAVQIVPPSSAEIRSIHNLIEQR